MHSTDDTWKADAEAFSFKDGTRTILFNNQRIKLSVNKLAYIQGLALCILGEIVIKLFRFIYTYLILDYHNYINNKNIKGSHHHKCFDQH